MQLFIYVTIHPSMQLKGDMGKGMVSTKYAKLILQEGAVFNCSVHVAQRKFMYDDVLCAKNTQ